MASDLDIALKRVFDPRTRRLLLNACTAPPDPDHVDRDNQELIERLAEPIDLLVRLYFRFELSGIDDVPAGPALLVMNHECGISDLEVLGLGARWYRRRGAGERLVGLMHDAMFDVPYLGNLLSAFGAVRASHAMAEEALSKGLKVVVSPGGNIEAFRPWKERHRIKFAGHKGWARLALRAGVPIVPIVFNGGHESFMVLHDGGPIVRRFGLKRFARIDTFPLYLGLPWGVGLGPFFHLPLPTKVRARFLSAIPLDPYLKGFASGLEASQDDATVSRLYTDVTELMQIALSDMAAHRRLPIIG